MKYKNYLNTKSGSNRIYSTDNLLQMTMNDILDAEDALGYQYNTIGLPDDSDLFNSSFVRQTRTPKGTLEWQSILDDGIAPQTNIVNHIVDPQTSNLKTPPFVPQYKQVMNTTPQNFFSTQKSTYELLEEERERQRQQQLQQQQLVQNLGNTPVQTPTSSMPMEDIAPVDLGRTSIDMNLVGDLVNTAVNKYKTWKKKPESKSVLKDAIDTEVTNKPLKQTDLQEVIKTSTTPDVEDSKTTSSIGNAIDEATTLRNDPLWDELTKSLPNATPEGEWDLVEQQRLKNFDKVWNEKNGVQPKGGVPTGGASGVDEPLKESNTHNVQPTITINSVMPKVGYKTGNMCNNLMDYNNEQNRNFKDARDCMNIALIGPENIQNTQEYKVANNSDLKQISTITNFQIPNDSRTVLYKSNSSLANSITASNEFRAQINNWLTLPPEQKNNNFSVQFNNDPNLFRSLHNATVLNPKVENGYFTGYVYDRYDFRYQDFDNIDTYIANTGAVALQGLGQLSNYYILVPVRIKL